MKNPSIQKLLDDSERIDLPRQETYNLPLKSSFVTTAVLSISFAILCGILYVTGMIDKAVVAVGIPPIIVYIMAGLPTCTFVYGLIILLTLKQNKAVFDDRGISIPDFLPSRKIRLGWDDVEAARIREITTPLGREIVLEVSDTGRFENATVFPVMLIVKDQALAVRIIREKLGAKFITD